MIIYFSGTGNCEFIAKKIAYDVGDNAISMTEINGDVNLNSGESLGIVVPTYFWGLPVYVDDFLRMVNFNNAENSYIYFIATYGTTTGQTDYFANKILKSKNLKLSASYGIKTVDNWTVWFEVNDKRVINQCLEKELEQTNAVILSVKDKKNVFIDKDKKSVFMCKCAGHFYQKARKTSHFHVTDGCISCGTCESGCPEKAIKMTDGKISWVKDKCSMCFRCLHRCPQFAIQYGKKTQKNGQYVHPKFEK